MPGVQQSVHVGLAPSRSAGWSGYSIIIQRSADGGKAKAFQVQADDQDGDLGWAARWSATPPPGVGRRHRGIQRDRRRRNKASRS